MNCKHTPKDPIAAFVHVCKHCGQDIDYEHCKTCDGTGSVRDRDGGLYECRRCKGSGVKRWVEISPPSPDKPSPKPKADSSPDCTVARCADGSTSSDGH